MKSIAILHSQLHLNAFHAYYLFMQKEGNSLNGVLVIRRSGNEEYLIDRKDCLFAQDFVLENRIDICKSGINKLLDIFQDIFYSRLVFASQKKSGETLLYIIPDNTRINFKDLYQRKRTMNASQVHVIFLEEGIGSYIRDLNRWKERGIESSGAFKKKIHVLRSNFSDWIRSGNVKRQLIKKGNIQYFKLFYSLDGKLFPNKEICKYFSEAFYYKSLILDKQINYKDTVIINSQPFMEEIRCNEDIECYKEIQSICKQYGYKLIVKPHPREKYFQRYIEAGLEVDCTNGDISQEILLAKSGINKPRAIAGFFSTTLITAKLFFNIPTICLGRLVSVEKMKGYKTDIENFIFTFAASIEIPENYKQFKEFIKKNLEREDES